MSPHLISGMICRATLWGMVALVTLGTSIGAHAQSPATIVRQALLANPVTAPYNLLTADRNGQVILAGTVGSKQIHDIAIRLAIALGYPIRDDLVIDTAAAHRVAAVQAQMQAQAAANAMAAAGGTAPGGATPALIPSLGIASGTPYLGSLPYVYPPPLFGRLDDPFFGFEPPLLSYPPWWRGVGARDPVVSPAPGALGANPGTGAAAGVGALPSSLIQIPLGTTSQEGSIEMTIDPRGVAVLRGNVPTLADRITIGQKIAQTPGVSEVINMLQVPMATATGTATTASPENPPPPPPAGIQPGANPPALAAPNANAAAPPIANEAAPGPAIVVDGGAMTDRLTQAFSRRPALAGLPIKVTVRDGVATLSGRVPTVYEAMLAYRVLEQTPGIREVIDRLEFVVPDGERQNPLIQQGRPEDVEPYLTAQIRRNVGDLAHIDRVRIMGDTLDVRGSLVHAEDRPRFEAILRSMAVLRGFRLELHVDAE